MSNKEFSDAIYFGSNIWLNELRDFINKEIEIRKSYNYELFFRVFYTEQIEHEHKHIFYMNDCEELKKNAKKIIDLPNNNYSEIKVFVRRLNDNYTLLIAKKIKNQMLEITENFFKF